MFNRPGRPSPPAWPGVQMRMVRQCWVPAADVYETANGWIVKFELAGVRREDVVVTLEGNTLQLRGNRRDWQAESGRCHSLEIPYERFERRIELSHPLAHSRMTTEYHDGMLLVTVITEETLP